MYSRKYKETSEVLYNYLEELYEASSHKYINTILKESTCFEIKNDLTRINEYTSYLEDFIHEVLLDLENSKTKIKRLKKLKTISILNHKRRKMFSIIYYKNNIELNPELSKETTKKLLYNNFNHRINKVID